MSSRSLVLLGALLLSSLPLSAGADDDLGRTGGYVGIAGTWAIENFDDVPSGVSVDDGVGLNARAGYRFHPNLAAELQLEWVPEFDVDTGGFFGDAEIETLVTMLNGKAYAATGRIQPYFLVGMGALYARADVPGPDPDDTGFAARLGGGTEIYILPELAAVLEGSYVFATGDVNDFDYGSIVWGLLYRF